MAYHILAWRDWGHLYTWGTYGVYIFFVLSGASMYVAYAKKISTGYSISTFLGLRLIRLMPLYALAMLVTVSMKFWASGFDLERTGHAYLNLFFLFGLGNPGATSQVTGGWSLGIEFVFYVLFPVALSLMAGRHWAWMLLLTFTSQHVFINLVFGNGLSLADNWTPYTQFLSFIFYFSAGCAIGRFAMTGRKVPFAWLAMIGLLVVIGLASGNAAEATLTGLSGMALSTAAVLTVAASSSLRFGPVGGKAADLLGKSSYGVYILHPFITGKGFGFFDRFLHYPVASLTLAMAVTVALALLIERFFEQPIQRYMKRRFTDKVTSAA